MWQVHVPITWKQCHDLHHHDINTNCAASVGSNHCFQATGTQKLHHWHSFLSQYVISFTIRLIWHSSCENMDQGWEHRRKSAFMFSFDMIKIENKILSHWVKKGVTIFTLTSTMACSSHHLLPAYSHPWLTFCLDFWQG